MEKESTVCGFKIILMGNSNVANLVQQNYFYILINGQSHKIVFNIIFIKYVAFINSLRKDICHNITSLRFI